MSAQLHSPFLDLLKQIESGVTIFQPFGRTPEKLREFDDTVARLKEMEQLGLIRQLFTQARTSFGEEQVNLVMVVGGLTEEAKRLLRQFETHRAP
ncbi:MAG: hypothetical protein H0W76_22860 [Pyrinomonadaceae bacterium]|nr:hypothetical protein [Pyrinomonadaceae bacterium]